MTQITIGDSAAGAYHFAGQLTVDSSGAAGLAYYGPYVGNYTLGPMAATVAGPEVNGIFPFAGVQTFDFTVPLGHVAGTVHWSQLSGSQFPALIGEMWIPVMTGAPEFVTDFGSHTASVDLILALQAGSPPIDNLTGGQTYASISAGEAVPLSFVPEPSAVALLATALLAACLIRRGYGAAAGKLS